MRAPCAPLPPPLWSYSCFFPLLPRHPLSHSFWTSKSMSVQWRRSLPPCLSLSRARVLALPVPGARLLRPLLLRSARAPAVAAFRRNLAAVRHPRPRRRHSVIALHESIAALSKCEYRCALERVRGTKTCVGSSRKFSLLVFDSTTASPLRAPPSRRKARASASWGQGLGTTRPRRTSRPRSIAEGGP